MVISIDFVAIQHPIINPQYLTMSGPPKQSGANPFGQKRKAAQPVLEQPANVFRVPTAFRQQNTTALFDATTPATGIFGQTATPTFGSTAAPTFGLTVPTQTTLSKCK